MTTSTLLKPQRSGIACLSLPKLLSVGDLDSAAACFSRDACLLTPDATAIHGRDHIRPLLAQLIARHVRVEVEQSNLLEAGDVAFARELWRVNAEGSAASRFEDVCTPLLVLNRIEGSWKIAIAALWGWGERRG
jgi:ketosteroid isomerase-like protein